MEGYEKLAGMMGDKPTLGIFRRFASVGAQNLLYLQAELIYLEKRWQECAKKDHESGIASRADCSGDWLSLIRCHERGESEQWRIFLELRQKLKEYSTIFLRSMCLLICLGRRSVHAADFHDINTSAFLD
jgi:hypothetical protein